MKKIFLFSLILIILESCTIYGLTNDYSKLTENEKKLIKTDTDFSNLKSKYIYTINASQLKKELKKNEKSLVYIFTNNCTSNYCLPMNSYISFANENGYKLYLVMAGYGKLNKTLQQNFDSPLFAIDYKYYNTKYKSTAWDRFENELRNRPLDYKIKEYEGNLFYFEKDKLLKVELELPNL